MTKDRDRQKTVCLDQSGAALRPARPAKVEYLPRWGSLVFRAFMSAPVEAEAITSSSIPLPPRRRAKSGDRCSS